MMQSNRLSKERQERQTSCWLYLVPAILVLAVVIVLHIWYNSISDPKTFYASARAKGKRHMSKSR